MKNAQNSLKHRKASLVRPNSVLLTNATQDNCYSQMEAAKHVTHIREHKIMDKDVGPINVMKDSN